MYIKRVYKRNKGSKIKYTYLHLVESIRTPKGPRQKLILNLGAIDIKEEDWPILVDKIQTLLLEQADLFPEQKGYEELNQIAEESKNRIIKKRAIEVTDYKEYFKEIDINSINPVNSRTIGNEYIGHKIWEELGLTDLLNSLKLSEKEIDIAKALIIGRLVKPASELSTLYWLKKLSAIDEILHRDLSHLSKNIIYEIGDKLYSNKEKIEKHLAETEKSIFSLEENIILYDLTNTYFEGLCRRNPKAKFGRSKEKRSDCRLMAVGLVIDELGFPKASEFFEGNISESSTFEKVIEKMLEIRGNQDKKPIIVIDAGIATQENIEYLKNKQLNYVCVKRGGIPEEIDINTSFETIIKEDEGKDIKIEVKKYEIEDEVYLYCKSRLKEVKEKSIIGRLESLLIQNIDNLNNSIKKGTIKKEEAVNQKIGRIKEKYSRIAKYYEISLKNDNNKYRIEYKKDEEKIKKVEGTYLLRSNLTSMSEERIWSIYTMLTNIENSFKCLKSELGLRPNFHQKENRVEAHIFITLLAYHLLNCIEIKLKSHDDHRSWATINKVLSSHIRLTISMKTKEGEGIHVRTCTAAEEEHKDIYRKLKLSIIPLPVRRYIHRL